MSDNKENEIIVGIGDKRTDQNAEQRKNADSVEEIKQQAAELFKAAGGFAGSLGKFAKKKGTQFREKLEDEEFQEKVSSSFNKAADKIGDVLGSGTVVNVKGGGLPETRIEQNGHPKSDKKEADVDNREIETTFEVEGDETVNFETKKPPKGLAKVIEQGRAGRKADKERKKAEKERKRKEQQKQAMMAALLLLGIAVICMVMSNLSKDEHEGQIHAPLTSLDAYELNYEDVIKQFEEAGFTNVEAMKMEDLVIGWLSSDGGVDKVTINGEEEYQTSSWYDPSVKVLVYYHTYPEEAKEEEVPEESVESEEPELAEEDASSAEKSKLQTFVGKTVAVADPEIKSLGYEPKYIALNSDADMTSDIEYSDNKDAWKIKSMDDFDASAKTVSYMVATKEIEEIVEKEESAKSKLSNNEARDIAYKWINNNWSSSFRMKDIPQYSIVDGKIAIRSLCTFKDNSGNKYDGEVIAYVNPNTKDVDLVEIRNSSLGIVWSYGE